MERKDETVERREAVGNGERAFFSAWGNRMRGHDIARGGLSRDLESAGGFWRGGMSGRPVFVVRFFGIALIFGGREERMESGDSIAPVVRLMGGGGREKSKKRKSGDQRNGAVPEKAGSARAPSGAESRVNFHEEKSPEFRRDWLALPGRMMSGGRRYSAN